MVDRSEELRFALVLNGGVSLAVWIGGVANEIARAVTEAHPVYRGLMDLTGTNATVDVICGSSAGGINGAALAMALQTGTDFSLLREVWLEKGAFTELLRDPAQSSPRSLLDGDGVFLPALEDAFKALRGITQPSGTRVRLTLTATLLHARPRRTTDDLGATIEDAEHRARFQFAEGDFADPNIARRLAFASRATASFPVAFEPVFCKVDDTAAPDNYRRFVDFPNSRFLIDGGVLDNKPFEAALGHIFSMPASGAVRRVLAYVVPDPGITANADADDPKSPPALGEVALASLSSIPSAETIAAQIGEIAEHNRRVRKLHQGTIGLMQVLNGLRSRGEDTRMVREMFALYRRRRLDSAFNYILDSIEQQQRKGLGRRTRVWLKEVLTTAYVATGLGTKARWVPLAWSGNRAPCASPIDWSWGLFTVMFFVLILMEFLRRAERILQLAERERTRASGGAPVCRVNPLAVYWKKACELADRVADLRKLGTGSWQPHGKRLLELLAMSSIDDPEQVTRWLDNALDANAQQASGRPRDYGELGLRVADLLLEVRDRVAIETLRLSRSLPEVRDFHTMLEFFDQRDAAGVLNELLKLEVMQYAVGERPDKATEDIGVELVQISGRGVSPLGATPRLEEKLAGVQLAHFGAFYKRSWRANDWMHGRMDGSERLIRVLLNPDRLHRLYAGLTWDGTTASRFVLGQLLAFGVEGDADRMRAELAFLDDPSARVPETLDACCGAVVRAIHLDILRTEMPVVVAAARCDLVEGAKSTGTAAQLIAAATPTPGDDELKRLWSSYPLGRESIRGEAASDLMTRTVAHTVAVAHGALSGSETGLGPIRALFGALDLPVRMFYVFANFLLADSRTASGIGVSLGSVGTVLVLLSLVVDKFPEALGTFGWAVVAASVLLALMQARRGVAALMSGLLVLAILATPFSLVPAAIIAAAALLVFALARFPAVLGPLLLLAAALVSMGPDARLAAAGTVCSLPPLAGPLRQLCSGVPGGWVLDHAAINRAGVIGYSALAICVTWLFWRLLPKLVWLDRRSRKG